MSEPIALQLYTARSLTQEDFLGTLRKLAEIGYTAVEFAGYGGIPAPELRRELDALGIKTAGAHVGYKLWDENLTGAIEDLQALGAEYAAVPWLEPAMRPTTRDQVTALAETFNRWSEAARAAGIRLGYHNHDFEFQKIEDGATVYDAAGRAVRHRPAARRLLGTGHRDRSGRVDREIRRADSATPRQRAREKRRPGRGVRRGTGRLGPGAARRGEERDGVVHRRARHAATMSWRT